MAVPLPADLDANGAPILLEVWAPRCASCQAMETDLVASADAHPDIRLVRVDAGAEPETAASLRVLGTPTVIGIVDGAEVFRRTGRMTRTEIDQAFESLAGDTTPPVATTDGWLRVLAGATLIVAGFFVELSWPLFLGGASVLVWGTSTLLQRST